MENNNQEKKKGKFTIKLVLIIGVLAGLLVPFIGSAFKIPLILLITIIEIVMNRKSFTILDLIVFFVLNCITISCVSFIGIMVKHILHIF